MRYLMFMKHAETDDQLEVPAALMAAMEGFIAEGFGKGYLKDTAGLKGTADGFRIRSSGGKLKVTDGPFTEAREVVGGYALVDVASPQDAIAIARRFMEIHREHWPAFECECEVRLLDG